MISIGILIFTTITLCAVNHEELSLFGYKPYIVLSDSMKATDFAAGDLVISKKVDPTTLQVGDIITFQSTNPESYGNVVTHKIRRVIKSETEGPSFITYGTTTDTDDRQPVTASRVLGKYQFRFKNLGKVAEFLKSVPGYILCIFLPFFALIVLQGLDTVRKFQAYKRVEIDEMREEREQLQRERLEAKKMMEELLQLQQELLAKQSEDVSRVEQ